MRKPVSEMFPAEISQETSHLDMWNKVLGKCLSNLYASMPCHYVHVDVIFARVYGSMHVICKSICVPIVCMCGFCVCAYESCRVYKFM